MKTMTTLMLLGTMFAGIASLPTAVADCAYNLGGTCTDADCDFNVDSNCAYGGADCQLNLAGSECRDSDTACSNNVASGCWLGGTCDFNLLFASCRDDGDCTLNIAADCHDGGTCTVNIGSDCKGDCELNVAGSTCSILQDSTSNGAEAAAASPFDSFECALVPGLCEEISLAINPAQMALVGLYQDVYPNGQFGNFDCVYDRASNTSVFVERWGVHVEAGTLNGSTRNPIVNTNVYYPFVDTASGNAC